MRVFFGVVVDELDYKPRYTPGNSESQLKKRQYSTTSFFEYSLIFGNSVKSSRKLEFDLTY